MSVSLLYPDDATRESAGTVGRDALDQLAVRKLSQLLGLHTHEAEYFHGVLARPLTDPDAVAYRREILSAFDRRPELSTGLCGTFDRLAALRSDYAAGKRERRRILRSAAGEGIPGAALNLLRASGLTLKRCLLLLDAAEKTLSECASDARGLTALSDALCTIVGGEDFTEMIALCSRFETFSETAGTAIRLDLSPTGGQIIGELTDRSRILFVRPESEKKRFRLLKKNQPEPTPASPVDLRFFTLSGQLRSDSMIALAEQLDRIAEQFFKAFLPVGRELTFYRCALRYIGLLREKGAPICNASFGEALSFTGLYDPLLIADRESADRVIPNDLMPASSFGTVILGANGSGKTVWLRSVGLLQLFSQAGLPIPATSAKIPLYRQIFTHFSSGEKEFEAGSEAGRFEQEVREISSILDEIGEHGLILLNETFQTTAYREGAEGLSHILRYLASGGNHWMLTSHLTDLPRFFWEGEIALYRTDGRYKVRQDICPDPLA